MGGMSLQRPQRRTASRMSPFWTRPRGLPWECVATDEPRREESLSLCRLVVWPFLWTWLTLDCFRFSTFFCPRSQEVVATTSSTDITSAKVRQGTHSIARISVPRQHAPPRPRVAENRGPAAASLVLRRRAWLGSPRTVYRGGHACDGVGVIEFHRVSGPQHCSPRQPRSARRVGVGVGVGVLAFF